MTFIKINDRILDYNKHNKELLLVKNHVLISIYEVLRIYGFAKHECSFVNKDLNLSLKFKFEKLEEEKFV
ncbi:hypothetical protein CMO90_00035 [Candidatus Woesearchaeota archaeon]|jgi:hypothetical protein|nr:hypothetical protein [Candidatus Woesearchaeota archaeon]|tara:strand:- start:480 stop:689 length:210 start_codon:yes stop_codon:yes gene_type:complete